MPRKTVKAEIILMDPFVAIPEYKTSGSAGFDLASNEREPLLIAPGEVRVIPTGVRVKLPQGYVGMLTPRSGKSISGLSVNNAPGIIDDDYRDEIKVIAINNGNDTVNVMPGERIAQLVCVEFAQLELEVIPEFTPDEFNDRTGGLGSTGSR